MKAITIILLFISSIAFSQTKMLKENFGNQRIHAITSFSTDTVENVITYNADFTIYREGIDGSYSKEISKFMYNKIEDCIEYFATKPEFENFIIIEK